MKSFKYFIKNNEAIYIIPEVELEYDTTHTDIVITDCNISADYPVGSIGWCVSNWNDTLGNALISSSTNSSCTIPEIKDVIFNPPATIVKWADGTKTVVKCQRKEGDVYSKEVGLAMAISKKALGNKGNFNDVFSKWIKE